MTFTINPFLPPNNHSSGNQPVCFTQTGGTIQKDFNDPNRDVELIGVAVTANITAKNIILREGTSVLGKITGNIITISDDSVVVGDVKGKEVTLNESMVGIRDDQGQITKGSITADAITLDEGSIVYGNTHVNEPSGTTTLKNFSKVKGTIHGGILYTVSQDKENEVSKIDYDLSGVYVPATLKGNHIKLSDESYAEKLLNGTTVALVNSKATSINSEETITLDNSTAKDTNSKGTTSVINNSQITGIAFINNKEDLRIDNTSKVNSFKIGNHRAAEARASTADCFVQKAGTLQGFNDPNRDICLSKDVKVVGDIIARNIMLDNTTVFGKVRGSGTVQILNGTKIYTPQGSEVAVRGNVVEVDSSKTIGGGVQAFEKITITKSTIDGDVDSDGFVYLDEPTIAGIVSYVNDLIRKTNCKGIQSKLKLTQTLQDLNPKNAPSTSSRARTTPPRITPNTTTPTYTSSTTTTTPPQTALRTSPPTQARPEQAPQVPSPAKITPNSQKMQSSTPVAVSNVPGDVYAPKWGETIKGAIYLPGKTVKLNGNKVEGWIIAREIILNGKSTVSENITAEEKVEFGDECKCFGSVEAKNVELKSKAEVRGGIIAEETVEFGYACKCTESVEAKNVVVGLSSVVGGDVSAKDIKLKSGTVNGSTYSDGSTILEDNSTVKKDIWYSADPKLSSRSKCLGEMKPKPKAPQHVQLMEVESVQPQMMPQELKNSSKFEGPKPNTTTPTYHSSATTPTTTQTSQPTSPLTQARPKQTPQTPSPAKTTPNPQKVQSSTTIAVSNVPGDVYAPKWNETIKGAIYLPGKTVKLNSNKVEGWIIAREIILEGQATVFENITAEEKVVFDFNCKCAGSVEAKNVELGSSSTVEGNVTAKENVELKGSAEVRGDIKAEEKVVFDFNAKCAGSVEAKNVELGSSSTVEGNVTAVNIKLNSATVIGSTYSDGSTILEGNSTVMKDIWYTADPKLSWGSKCLGEMKPKPKASQHVQLMEVESVQPQTMPQELKNSSKIEGPTLVFNDRTLDKEEVGETITLNHSFSSRPLKAEKALKLDNKSFVHNDIYSHGTISITNGSTVVGDIYYTEMPYIDKSSEHFGTLIKLESKASASDDWHETMNNPTIRNLHQNQSMRMDRVLEEQRAIQQYHQAPRQPFSQVPTTVNNYSAAGPQTFSNIQNSSIDAGHNKTKVNVPQYDPNVSNIGYGNAPSVTMEDDITDSDVNTGGNKVKSRGFMDEVNGNAGEINQTANTTGSTINHGRNKVQSDGNARRVNGTAKTIRDSGVGGDINYGENDIKMGPQSGTGQMPQGSQPRRVNGTADHIQANANAGTRNYGKNHMELDGTGLQEPVNVNGTAENIDTIYQPGQSYNFGDNIVIAKNLPKGSKVSGVGNVNIH